MLAYVTLHRAESMWNEDPRDIRWKWSLGILSPTSHLEQDHHQYQIHPFPGTLNWMSPVLLYIAFNILLSAWECLQGKQPERRTKREHLQALPSSLDKQASKQATSKQVSVLKRWGRNQPLSQLLIISEKGIVVQRIWSQQSSGEGERALPRLGPCRWHPLGCVGVRSSALTKEPKQVI